MGFADVINAVLNRREEKQDESIKDFHDLVLRLANNEDISPETVEQSLNDAGKSIDDLKSAVERIINRRNWAEQLKQAPIIKKKIDALDAVIKSDDEAYQLVVSKYRQKKESDQAELLRLQSDLSNLDYARIRIAETADPEFDSQAVVIGRQIYRLQKTIEELRETEREINGKNELDLRPLRDRGQTVNPSVGRYWRKLTEIRDRIKQAEEQTTALKLQIAQIDAQKAVVE